MPTGAIEFGPPLLISWNGLHFSSCGYGLVLKERLGIYFFSAGVFFRENFCFLTCLAPCFRVASPLTRNMERTRNCRTCFFVLPEPTVMFSGFCSMFVFETAFLI